MKGQLYVFGGLDHNNSYLNSIECINASQVTSSSNNSAQWVVIQVSGQIFTPRTFLIAAPLNATEIIITGGQNGGGIIGDAYKFNVETKEMSKIFKNDYKFYCQHNQGM